MPEANRVKATEFGLMNVLIQDGREVAEAYRCPGTPSAILVDSAGRTASSLAMGAHAIRSLMEHVTEPKAAVLV